MPTHIIAAAGIVINEKDEILMVKTHHGGWVFPGGQVEVGENVIDAVKREVMEETGIDIEVGEVFVYLQILVNIPDTTESKKYLPRSCLISYVRQKAAYRVLQMRIPSLLYFPRDGVEGLITAPAIVERYKA